MSNFTYSSDLSLLLSDGMRIRSQLVDQVGNAKLILDDDFAPGDTVDLTHYLESITIPAWFLVTADGDGVTINMDSLGPSTKYYKLAFFQPSLTLPAPQGAIVMSLTLPIAPSVGQHIQVIALGNA